MKVLVRRFWMVLKYNFNIIYLFVFARKFKKLQSWNWGMRGTLSSSLVKMSTIEDLDKTWTRYSYQNVKVTSCVFLGDATEECTTNSILKSMINQIKHDKSEIENCGDALLFSSSSFVFLTHESYSRWLFFSSHRI